MFRACAVGKLLHSDCRLGACMDRIIAWVQDAWVQDRRTHNNVHEETERLRETERD